MRVKGFFSRDRADQEAFSPTTDIPRSTTQSAVEYVETLGGGAGGTDAPVDAQYLVSTLNTTLTNERVVGNGTGITWDFTGTGTAVANLDFLGLEDLTDPAADRILFWDDSETALKFLTITGGLGITGANLSISDTDLAGIRDTTFALGDLVVSDGSALTKLVPGATGMYLRSDGPGNALIWANISGGGDVTANSVWGTDNLLIRSDGTGKGVQASGITIDDTNNVTGVTSITVGNTGLTVGASVPFSDTAGVLTLQNIDALDATTEATIEAAIDTLGNLGSIQGVAFTFGSYAATLLNNTSEATFKAAVNLEIGTDVQAYDIELAAIAGLTSAANKGITFTGSGTASTYDLSAFALTFLDDADASAVRSTLGLAIGTNVQAYDAELAALAGLTSAADALPYFTGSGTAATTTLTTFGRSLIDDADATTARSTLGLVIGTNVQAFDAELAAIAGLVSAADRLPYFTGSGTASLATFTSFGRSLVDDADATAARTTLGLGTMATETASNYLTTATAASTYQPLDTELTALAGLTSAADRLPYFTGAGTAALATFTTFGRSLVDDADASTARTTLGLAIGTDVQAYNARLADVAALVDPNADRLLFWDDSAGALVYLTLGTNLSITGTTLNASGGGGGGLSDGDYGDIVVSGSTTAINIDSSVLSTFGRTLIDDADAATARATLGLAIGTDVQAYDATLASLASLGTAANKMAYTTGVDTWAEADISAFGRSLIDDADASAARTTLGLGTLATQSGTFSGTSSGTNTGDQNLFSTIAVSGQSDVVADSATDTLTLAAGSNITITTNAATDTITISASGGGGGVSRGAVIASYLRSDMN